MSLDNEKLLEIYRRMLLVRTIEEAHDRLLKEGSVEGACGGSCEFSPHCLCAPEMK